MSESSRVILGDCREILPTLAVGTGWAVITDPPYGADHYHKGMTHRTLSDCGASWGCKPIAGDTDTSSRDFVIDWASRLHLPWACFGSWKTGPPPKTRGSLVWDKGPAFGMGDLSFPWKGSWELIYVGGQGWSGRRDESVLRGHLVVTWKSLGRLHPMEKPVGLIAQLIAKLPEIRVIIDPFAGSGSIGVAALRAGKSFIGIEIDPTYHQIASDRLERATGELPLFTDQGRKQSSFLEGSS